MSYVTIKLYLLADEEEKLCREIGRLARQGVGEAGLSKLLWKRDELIEEIKKLSRRPNGRNGL